MRDYLSDKNKLLKLENTFLKKKLEMIKEVVENKAFGSTKILMLKILDDKGKAMCISEIADLFDCSISTLKKYLSRAEFSKFRAEHSWYVNRAFRDMLRKVLKKDDKKI